MYTNKAIDRINQAYCNDLVLNGQSEIIKKMCEEYKKFTNKMCEEYSNDTHEDDPCE